MKDQILLPKVEKLIIQLKSRLINLQEKLKQTFEPDEEIALEEEKTKLKSVLFDLQKNQIEYIDNDLVIINTHTTLELEYFKMKKKIEEKMNHFQLLTETDVNLYNTAMYKVNLFVNVTESIY